MFRWDMDETDRLPNYMKIFYHFIMSTYEDFERDAVKHEKKFAASYLKETVSAYIHNPFIYSPIFLSYDIDYNLSNCLYWNN